MFICVLLKYYVSLINVLIIFQILDWGFYIMDISLIIVAFASLVTPLLLAKLKISTLPTAVAEIIVGIVLGKSLLNLVSETSLLSQLSTIGVIYLLF